MAKKSQAQRIERLEAVCMGMGFLLQKLQAKHGDDFGEGTRIQVREAIRDYQQIAKAREQRQQATKEPQP